MADYDRAELERLQAEAAQRIREMHSRAQPQPENQPSENASYTDMPGMPPMPSFIKLDFPQRRIPVMTLTISVS